MFIIYEMMLIIVFYKVKFFIFIGWCFCFVFEREEESKREIETINIINGLLPASPLLGI